MLPYADEPQPQARSFPYVTIGIILVCIAVFAHEVALGQAGAEAFSARWGFTPADFWAGRNLVTLVTALFLHAGLLHIAGNLIFLWVFGDNVEDQLGHVTYLLVYLGSGIVASVTFAIAFPHTSDPLVGASGAIAGVLGGYLLLFPRAMVRTLLAFVPFVTVGRVAAVILIGFWFLLQLIEGAASVLPVAPSSDVAFLAHVGGFMVGLIATGVIREARDQEVSHWIGGRDWWSRSFRNWLLLAIGITLVAGLGGVALHGAGGLTASLVRSAAGGGVIAVALLDGVARLFGRRALLGSGPHANRFVAVLQIVAALALGAALLTT
ncbi:MAG TPA: rhomboid family intramembrane serine protease [Thermomicrobiaceae bacterium]|nr:rhomboid family intramembrane serine protease [Thermomicrobiaceae bacterium]